MEVHRFYRKVETLGKTMDSAVGMDTSRTQIQLYFPGRAVAGFTEGKLDFYTDSEHIISSAESLINGSRNPACFELIDSVYNGVIQLPKDIVESFTFRAKVARLAKYEFDKSTRSLLEFL